MKRFFYILLFAFFACDSFAEVLSQTQKFHQFKLKNGMQIFIYQDYSLPIVAHTLLYKVGSANDPRGKSGLAHYLEHLMFRSTKNLDDVTAKIHDLNGQYNAMTSDYFTIYYELVTKDRLKDVMQLEAERMQNLKITDESADLERKIVLQERKQRLDSSPFAILMEEMHAAFYKNDRAWNTIGWESEILALNREDANEMYSSYYNPANAVLILVGDVDLSSTSELINKYYGAIKGTEQKESCCTLVEPERKSDLNVTMNNTINQERAVAYLFDAPNVSDESYIHALLGAYVLGGGKTSRLYAELAHNLNLALSVYVDYRYLTKSSSTLCISAVPINANVTLESLQENIDRVISDILQRGITNEELEIAKSSAKLDLIKDGLQSMSLNAAISIANGAGFDHYHQLSNKINSVDLNQINSTLSKILKSNRVIGILGK